jgi:hypothetical protein
MNRQWQNYRDMELIPAAIPAPRSPHRAIVSRGDQIWRSLVDNVIAKFSDKRRTEHLERCFTLTWYHHGTRPHNPSNPWRTMWLILNQPLFCAASPVFPEPEIEQILDPEGRTWWCAYDPRTGQKTYMESEEEVQNWLEERFHRSL